MPKQEYSEFVEKFKPKVTTDDCYTPEPVYEAVLAWCEERYGVDRGNVVRPFYPGGDYERFGYPRGCAVIDNPPFSLLSKIVRFYCQRGIRFLLSERAAAERLTLSPRERELVRSLGA